MADKNSGWLCNATVSIVSETNTTATIRVTSYWKSNGWRYDINRVSSWVYVNGTNHQVMSSGSVNTTSDLYGSVNLGYHDFVVNKTTSDQSIPCCAKITSESTYVSGTKWSGDIYVTVKAKPSYTVTYNANGGSGAPGNQTKWHDTNLTLSSSKPSRTGHNFVRWNTNTSNTGAAYSPGATYSGNANLTLYAIWTPHTYTVTYNANGGSGAPGNQTKTYGVNLSLSTTKPTRTNYNFKGWSTSANGGVVYGPGSTYSNNSAVTLYAVWELAYQKPRITGFKAHRCTSDGTASETGTYMKVTFNWATDYNVTAIWIDWTLSTDKYWNNYSNSPVTASGKSGSVSQVVGGGNINTESSYLVRGYVDDGTGNTHSTIVSVGTVKFPIDVKAGGTGVAMGKVAETDNLLDVAWDTKIKGDLHATTINSLFSGIINGATWWVHVGDFKFTNQGQYAIIDCYLGDGQNGGHTQNTHMKILLKQGWSGETLPIGVTTNFTQNYAGTNRVRVGIHHNEKDLCQLFICLGFAYSDLTCIVNGSYETFTSTMTYSTTAPTIDTESAYYYNGGYVLYDNSSGSNGTITLSQTAGDFNYLEIFYSDSKALSAGTPHNSIKINTPNGKTVSLTSFIPNDTANFYMRYSLRAVTINGASITNTNYYDAGYMNTNGATWWHANEINIHKVIGYR